MNNKIWFDFISCVCITTTVWKQAEAKKYINESNPQCWLSLGAQELFRAVQKIDNEYATIRKLAQKYLDKSNFNKRILETKLVDGIVVHEEVPNELYKGTMPGGLNLGGLCIMKMPNIVLFFDRMALQQNTFFQINVLHNDIENLVLRAHISLYGIHLVGGYRRCTTDTSVIRCADSFGQIQIFVEDIKYMIEGRYRLVRDRMVIEQVVSSIAAKNVLMTYINANDTDPSPVRLEKQYTGDFMIRLKTDLDKWFQDYFNTHLIVTDLGDIPNVSMLREYNELKSKTLAKFVDTSLITINERIRRLSGDFLAVPRFKIIPVHGLEIVIFNGTMHGLDTLYRRSAATTNIKRKTLRYVNAIIGFTDLKIAYSYEVTFPPGPEAPPSITGILTMSTSDLQGHLSMGLLSNPEVVELDINFLNPMGAEAIKVEDPTNILRTNFKHILHNVIATLISNSLMYGVGLIRTLPRCVPFVPGLLKTKSKGDIFKAGNSHHSVPTE